ncbi:MAG: amidohydrolase family protein [Rhodospirillales bacterium]|nr:amidohydrolase family protein [Rhodospirillales bacterium]
MRIDVHAHLWSEHYLDLLARLGNSRTAVHRGLGAGETDDELRKRFELMDGAGIEMQVLSVTPASPHFERQADAVEAARAANDEYAALTRRFPQRFRAFAALPLPHTEAALAELGRALDELGMVGAAVTTSVAGRSLADPAFHPLYTELNRRKSVLYIHPAGCGADSPLINGHRIVWSVGAPIEDTIAIMHLVIAGIPSRYPDMKIIASHLGGLLPMVVRRVDDHMDFEAPDTPEKPSLAFRRLWYDTVGHNHVPALRAAAEALGADRLLLGTDFPYQPGELFHAAVDYVRRAGLSEDDVRAILDRNAASLFGLPSASP